jgi:hypothetical protein
MGSSTAADFAEYAPDRRTALSAHFRSNCFPPVPLALVEPAERAILAVEEDIEDGHATAITLPDGRTVPAGYLVEALHLHAFITQED